MFAVHASAGFLVPRNTLKRARQAKPGLRVPMLRKVSEPLSFVLFLIFFVFLLLVSKSFLGVLKRMESRRQSV